MALGRLHPLGLATVEEMAQGSPAQPAMAIWLIEQLAGSVAWPRRPVASLAWTKPPIGRLDLELDLKWLRSRTVEEVARGWPGWPAPAKALWLSERLAAWVASLRQSAAGLAQTKRPIGRLGFEIDPRWRQASSLFATSRECRRTCRQQSASVP